MELLRQPLTAPRDVARLRRISRTLGAELELRGSHPTAFAAAVAECARAILTPGAPAQVVFRITGRRLEVDLTGAVDPEREAPPGLSALVSGVAVLAGGLRVEQALIAAPSVEALERLARAAEDGADPLDALREQNEALRAAVEARRQVEARLALASETARLGVLFLDVEAGRLEANARARALHGITGPLDELEQLLEAIDEGADEVREGLRALDEGRAPLLEVTYRAVSGSWVLLRARLQPGGGRRVNATLLDVSRQKRAEAEQRRQAELREMMMGVASHDLRSPLQTIETGAALLRELVTEPDARRVVSRIEAASAQAARLVGDFFDYTQAHLGGGLPIRTERCDARALVDAVVQAASLRAGPDAVVVRGDSFAVHADPARLTQAMTNLVENALHHREGDAPVDIELAREASMGVIRVANAGRPLAPEETRRIFEPFARGKDTSREGLGLGLHIVKLVAEAHHGAVEARGAPEGRNVFELRLPEAPR